MFTGIVLCAARGGSIIVSLVYGHVDLQSELMGQFASVGETIRTPWSWLFNANVADICLSLSSGIVHQHLLGVRSLLVLTDIANGR